MKILALDCSGAGICAAITDDTTLLAETLIQSKVKHSVTLLPAIDSLFDSVGLTVADIDLFAVTAGPGSFTGVRIGVSLLKGLAFGTGKPCVAVSSLEALAANLKGLGVAVCPVGDARREQFYNALFDGDTRLCPDRLISADELAAEIHSLGKCVYLTGDGTRAFFQTESGRAAMERGEARPAPHRLTHMSGYCVAVCALENYNNGINIHTEATIAPLYLRKSQAEREREERIEQENGKAQC